MGEHTLRSYILGKNNLVTILVMLLSYIDNERWYIYSCIFAINWICKIIMCFALKKMYPDGSCTEIH